ncbi:MAG: tetratricopeptide repeat protein [Acetobacteraceae bacterium]|nr:tetratricopeptide repeat protein [Acetobacteraceae bacterium]
MAATPSVTITLCVRRAGGGAPAALLYHLLVDGVPVASNLALDGGQVQAVEGIWGRYSSLLEDTPSPAAVEEALAELGTGMFNVWLGPLWGRAAARVPVGAHRLLVIASDLPPALNLPWELLRPPGGDFLGLDPRFKIRRLPWPDRPLGPPAGALPPRPLRILFMACAPQDQVPLDYEREEEAVFKAVSLAGPNVVLETADLGTFEELRQRINDFQPQVVHLSGHGIVKEDGLGYFCFEDEDGRTDLRSSVEIRQQLFAGSGVQCAFISGCQSGQAPPIAALGGVCQGLVGDEVPLAVGWAASVLDVDATRFAAAFYNTLASGRPVDRALVQARQAIRKSEYPTWTLPVLYAATAQGLVFDPDPARPPALPPRPSVVQLPLPGMVQGGAEAFVGARRHIQRLLPALRDGRLQAVLLTGEGGGKSALATRLARKLEAEGFLPIPVASSPESPLGAARLLQSCGDAFLAAGLRDAYHTLQDPAVPVDARLRYVVSVLNRGRFVLVLDGFEANMDQTTRRVLDPELAGFYLHLLTNLSGGSRAIVTSRFPPADPPQAPPTVHEEPLADFPPASFLKSLLLDPEVQRRYYRGELPPDLVSRLYGLLGPAPRLLPQLRAALRTASLPDLVAELSAFELPAGLDAPSARSAREGHLERVLVSRLYDSLAPASQRALCRAAVCRLPLSLAGLGAVTGEPVDRLSPLVQEWGRCALAASQRGKTGGELWAIPAQVRRWLLQPERLSPEDRRGAQLAAGDFLRGLEGEGREGELDLAWIDCLLEARAQYLSAGACDRAREVTDRLSGRLAARGLYQELVRINHDLLAFEEHPGPMRWIGLGHLRRGDYAGARRWFSRCLEAAGDEHPAEAAGAWSGLASVDLEQGSYGEAREKLLKAIDISRQAGSRSGEAAAWHQLATVDLHQGSYGAAREGFLRSLEISRGLRDRAAQASALHQLATLDLHQGCLDRARQGFESSLALKVVLGDLPGQAVAWHNLASIDLREGRLSEAREKLERSLSIKRQVGDRPGEAVAWHQLGSLDLEEGELQAAREKMKRALALRQELGDRRGEAVAWHQMACIDLREGNLVAARERFLRALQMRQEIGDRAGEAATFNQLGVLAAKLGRPAEGLRLAALCYLIDRSVGHGDAESDLKNLQDMAASLGWPGEQLQAVLQEAEDAYARDGGRGLLEAALPEGRRA